MASCCTCGTTILFGGVRDDGGRYCNDDCMDQRRVQERGREVPEELVARGVRAVLDGPCPVCAGPGPVDLFHSHTVTSMLVVTSWRSRARISCRGCATRAQLGAIAHSALLGWWGVPWGLVMAPVQITRNLRGLLRAADPAAPSALLGEQVRAELARAALGCEPRRAA